MAGMKASNVDWVRRNQDRYLSDETPQGAMDAIQHVLAARAALEVGEIEVAEIMYLGARKLWRRMERQDPGHWGDELRETTSEMHRIQRPYHH